MDPKAGGGLWVVDDTSKEVWCFYHQAQPYKRISLGNGFTSPNGIAFDKAGRLLVSDYSEGVVKLVTDDAQHQTVISGLNKPYGIAVDTRRGEGEGDILVADSGSEELKVFTSEFKPLRQFKLGFPPVDVAVSKTNNGPLVVIGYGGQMAVLDAITGAVLHAHMGSSGCGTTAGVAVDSADRIYVTQHHQKEVVVFKPDLKPLGPIRCLPELNGAWGIKVEEEMVHVAEVGRVRSFLVEYELSPKCKA